LSLTLHNTHTVTGTNFVLLDVTLTVSYKELGNRSFARDQSGHHCCVVQSVGHVYCSLALHIHSHHSHHCYQCQWTALLHLQVDKYTSVTTSDANKHRHTPKGQNQALTQQAKVEVTNGTDLPPSRLGPQRIRPRLETL